ADASATVATNLVEQRFIFKRSAQRWLMHFLIMWGRILSALITFPPAWGWLHFKLEGVRAYRAYVCGFPPQAMASRSWIAPVTFPLVWGWIHCKLEGVRDYRAYVFGFPLQAMDSRSVIAWVTFHALDFTAIMVIAGCAIAIHRRLKDRGAIAYQTYLLDFTPHMLLIAISVSGLMLTVSSLWLAGYMYHFIALSHQAIVIMTLFFLPFGKLFHIVQRPASVGVELYQKRSQEMEQAVCPRCGTMFAGK